MTKTVFALKKKTKKETEKMVPKIQFHIDKLLTVGKEVNIPL